MTKRKVEDTDWENTPCPLCTTETLPKQQRIQWIACEAKICRKWFHCSCLDIVPKSVVYYYCDDCTALGKGRTRRREERPKRSKAGIDYNALDSGQYVNSLRHAYTSTIESKSFARPDIDVMRCLTKEYLDEHGFTRPIIVHSPDELDMNIPADLTVSQVCDLIGRDRALEVMDVPTQGETRGWTLGNWADYYNGSTYERVRNVISLEVSDTALGKLIKRPKVVRDLDILEQYWPRSEPMPKVQAYCLMSIQNSYTDFHIDFAGTSVYYHIVAGAKTFLFIPPTSANFNKYTEWCKSSDQGKVFLADQCKETFKVELHKGDTMFIPAGWIHAVHTPAKALVIGGNFLHMHGMVNHLKVTQIETITKVPGKFRFPQFVRTLWIAMLGILGHRTKLCDREVPGAYAMAEYLMQDVTARGNGVPYSRIKGDPLNVVEIFIHYLAGTSSQRAIILVEQQNEPTWMEVSSLESTIYKSRTS